MENNSIEFSVVIPCLNEERTIATCVGKALGFFERSAISGEVVVVDNGSTDRSAEVAAAGGARVVVHEVTGYGSALRRGIAEARGTFVIMADGDDTYDFSEMGEFVRRLRAGDDLVMGSRLRGSIGPGAMPWLHRYVGTPMLSRILSLFFGCRISDANCGMRGFARKAILDLNVRCSGMEFASEMIVKAAQGGLKISETPVSYRAAPRDRTAHLRTFRDGWRHLRFMLILCPRYLFLFPGLGLFLVGVVFTGLLLARPVTLFGVHLGLSVGIFAGALMFIGVQVALFGVFCAIFYSSAGLKKEDRLSRYFRLHFTLEGGLVLGAIVLVAGIVLGLVTIGLLAKIAGTPGVNIPLTRLAAVSVFIALLGVQIIFFSFYLGVFNLNKTLE